MAYLQIAFREVVYTCLVIMLEILRRTTAFDFMTLKTLKLISVLPLPPVP